MPSEFTLDTQDTVTPENKGGPVVGLGAKIVARRDSDGAIGAELLRGDGGDPEAFTYTVRTKWFTSLAGQEVTIEIAARDLFLPDFTPRTYRLRVVADGGADLAVSDGIIAPEPYAPAGTV